MNTTTKLHIYDVDGTILDSMRMWDRISLEYLASKGIKGPAELKDILDPMTLEEAAAYLIEHFHLPVTLETALDEIHDLIRDHYLYDLQLFPETTKELEAVAETGIPMVVLTNTPEAIVRIALERTGALRFFRHIYTTEMGLKKDDPAIFREVCRLEGVASEEALVHEDSGYAIEAAEKAGCMIKVYDRYRGRE